MFTKNDLIKAIDVYTNANGSYFSALANTLTFWKSTNGRGIIRTLVKDSPQYSLIKDFMSSQYFRNLSYGEEVSFAVFNEFVSEKDKEHRFSSEYIYADSGVVKSIIKPWFESLTLIDQNAILIANDVAFAHKNKSLTHIISELRNGMVDSGHATTRLFTAPVSSTLNLIEAVTHLPKTAKHIKETIVNRPFYALGTQIPGMLMGQLPVVAGIALANSPGLQTVISNMPAVPIVLPVDPELLLHIAEKAHPIVHVGSELNHAGEHDRNVSKYQYKK